MNTTQYPSAVNKHQRQPRGSFVTTAGANNFGSDQTEGGLGAGIDRQSPLDGFRGAGAMT